MQVALYETWVEFGDRQTDLGVIHYKCNALHNIITSVITSNIMHYIPL